MVSSAFSGVDMVAESTPWRKDMCATVVARLEFTSSKANTVGSMTKGVCLVHGRAEWPLVRGLALATQRRA